MFLCVAFGGGSKREQLAAQNTREPGSAVLLHVLREVELRRELLLTNITDKLPPWSALQPDSHLCCGSALHISTQLTAI